MQRKLRQQIIEQAWGATLDSKFALDALVNSAAAMAAKETDRDSLRKSLPIAWAKLDDCGTGQWYAHTRLSGADFDAVDRALDKGLPQGQRSRLNEYTLSPNDFPALLFLALIVSRLPGRVYDPQGPHPKVRAQLWHGPELAIAVIRNLPAKFDLRTLPELLSVLLPRNESGDARDGMRTAFNETIGETASPYDGRPRPPPEVPPEIGETPSPYGK